MRTKVFSHRFAVETLDSEDEFRDDWVCLLDAIHSIEDEEVIAHFGGMRRQAKSISQSLNHIIKERLTGANWDAESAIFQEDGYTGKMWRLDFSRNQISVEVAFNHGEAIAWNLLKPVMASELNHIQKAKQTKIGVVICATNELKEAGGFDNAVGDYEKILRYLKPMYNILPTPLAIVGIRAPETYSIELRSEGNRRVGEVRRHYG
jgi:Restriction endonuclease BglII